MLGETTAITPINRYGLPYNYRKLEYIEFTGTQYFTNLTMPTNFQIEALLYCNYKSSGPYNFYEQTGATNPMCWFYPTYLQFNGDGGSATCYTYTYNLQHKLLINATQSQYIIMIDDVQVSPYSGSKYTKAQNNPALFFHRASEPSLGFLGKVYYLKIYNGELLIYHLIPAVNKTNNIVGFYDIVNNQFYTNVGTGSFTAGPEI